MTIKGAGGGRLSCDGAVLGLDSRGGSTGLCVTV